MNTCTAIYPDSAKDTTQSAPAVPDSTLRPREKLLAHGAAALSNAELLAILLRTGSAQLNIMQFSHYVLEQAGGPEQLPGPEKNKRPGRRQNLLVSGCG